MAKIAALRRLLDRLSTGATLLGAYALLAASLVVCVDVVLRKAFTQSIVGTDELSGYALAAATSWGAGYAFFRGSHIRVDVVHRALPLPVRAWLDVLAVASMFVLGILLTIFGGRELVDALTYGARANTPLRTPLWLPLSVWAAGLAVFAAGTLVALVECVAAAITGDHRHVLRVTGTEGGGGAAVS